jgi:arginase
MELADAVERSLSDGGFPLVLGGDCSNLLGAVLGLRRTGGRGLIHLDGHSDFFHPGNYDACSRLGSVAGMDLALVTGRGEPLLTEWHGVARPLVEDADVIQIGEREGEDADYPFGEISLTDIWQMTVQAALGVGIHQAVERTKQRLVERELSAAWLHVDLDVLDQTVMPAVDSPGSPGLTYGTLAEMVRGLLATGRMVGMDVTIYDPDLDPDREYGREIVECLVEAVRV